MKCFPFFSKKEEKEIFEMESIFLENLLDLKPHPKIIFLV
tara:strand:- start:60 stop:179 length:120 start_codon:yes stop_codon:yes gene_type:complete